MFGGQTLTARFDVEFFYRWWEDRDGNGSPERQDTLYTGTATIPIRPPRALLELGTGDPMAEGLSLRLRPADGLNTRVPDSTAFRFEVDPSDRSYAEVGRVGESGHAVTAIYAESAADNVRLVVDPDLAPLDPAGCVVVGVVAQTERDYGLDPLALDVPACLEPRLEVAFARDTLRYGDRVAMTVTAADHVTGGVAPSFPVTVSVDVVLVDLGYYVYGYYPAELVHTGTGERGPTLEGVPFADLEAGLVELAADGEAALEELDEAVVRVRGDQPLGPLAPTGSGTAYVRGGRLDVEPTFDSLYVDQERMLEAVVRDGAGEVPLDPDRLFEVWTYPYQDARAGVLVNDRTGERDSDYLVATYADLRAGHVRFLADTTETGPPAARRAGAPRTTDGAAGRGARRAESDRLDLLRERARERGQSARTVRGAALRSANGARVANGMDERWVGVEIYDVDSYSLYGWVDLVVVVPIGSTESKDSITNDFVSECPDFGSTWGTVDREADAAYERSLANFIGGGLGTGYVSIFPSSSEGLDGYQSWYHDGTGRNPNYLSFLFEAKFTGSQPFSSKNAYKQAVNHINLLASERDRFFDAHPGLSFVGTPIYVVASQNKYGDDWDWPDGEVRPEWRLGSRGEDPFNEGVEIDYHDELVRLANSLDVAIIHAKVARVDLPSPLPDQWTRNLQFQFSNEVQWADHTSNPFLSWLAERLATVDPSQTGRTYTYPADLDLQCEAAQEDQDRPPPGGIQL